MSKFNLGQYRTSRKSLWLAFLLAGVLLYLALRGVAWGEMLGTVRQARLDYLTLACMTLSVSYFLRGLRWRVLLSAGKPVSALTAFWATLVGYLGNSLLPARAGEVMRSVMISRHAGLSNSYVFATALTERILDVVALVMISLAALMSLDGMPPWLLKASQVMTVLGLVCVAGLFIAPRLGGWLDRLLHWLPLPGGLRERVRGLLTQFLLGMRAFQHGRRAVSFTVLAVVIWLMDALVAVWVANALNLQLAFPEALVLLAALGLASAAPSTPGYVGVYQFVAVTILAPFGFSRNQSLAYILTFQAVCYAVVLSLGSIGFWRLSRQESSAVAQTAPEPVRDDFDAAPVKDIGLDHFSDRPLSARSAK